jgi:hypothetical protein
MLTDKPQISVESLLYKINDWHILHHAFFFGDSHAEIVLQKHINKSLYRIIVYVNGWKNELYDGADLFEVVRIWNNYDHKGK